LLGVTSLEKTVEEAVFLTKERVACHKSKSGYKSRLCYKGIALDTRSRRHLYPHLRIDANQGVAFPRLPHAETTATQETPV
jgi:hypothetical protein